MNVFIQSAFHTLTISALAILAVPVCMAQDFKAPPGRYHTSWVGNSFGGGGGANGFGDWVQNGADEIEVTPDGTVVTGTWNGDAPKRQVRRYEFGGWTTGKKPRYDWNKSQSWPSDFEQVRRIIYQPETDTLYLLWYLKGQKIDSWRVVGFTRRRYDGWLAGKPKVRWTNFKLPFNAHGSDQGGSLSASGVAAAGDYLFVGMVKPDDGRQYVHILRLSDGSYVGSFKPGDEVGGNAAWQDMPYSVQAMKGKNGEYLVLVEEDWRGKNLLYRWIPEERP
jgi:hypothetical protein